ncbi:MAG: hypothetical protein QNI88_02435 [Desulfobacterales bacterium]|nr:hypothetical protein [Desulfobacterales bacterium]
MRIKFCLVILLTLCSCSTKNVHICEIENGRHVGPCEQVVDKAYRYALLSVNSYETEENTPFALPAYVREVRHEDSQVSQPSREFIDSKVYSNGSFQAKVFEVRADDDEDGTDAPAEVVIAYRGTAKFSVPDLVDGTLTHNHRIKAVQLYEEIKAKYSGLNTVISLTGHSLGGALALEVIYTYPNDNTRLYVFNPSYQLTLLKKYNRLPEGSQAYSIEEIHDKVLGPLKIVWTKPKGLRIYKFSYVKSPFAGGHSKFSIALGLLGEAREHGGEEAVQIYEMNQKMYE